MGNSKSHHLAKKSQEKENKVSEGVTQPKYPVFLQRLSEVLLEKSIKEESSEEISCNTFKKCLCKAYEPLGEKLFYYFLRESEKEDAKEMSVEIFLKQSNRLLECHTEFQQLEYYAKAFVASKDEITYDEFYEFVTCAYEIATFARHTSTSPDDLLPAISKAVMHGKEKVTLPYVLHWLCEHCPRLVMWIHRYMCHILTVGYATVPNNEDTEENDTETPILDSATPSSCVALHPALLWMLSCTLPMRFIKNASKTTPTKQIHDPHAFVMNAMLADTPNHWVALYNSDNNGLSMNRFCHHVFDYHSPTLLFVSTDENMFCVAVDEAWKDSKHFYGGSSCMCIQLLPKYQIVEKGQNLIYFNQSSRGFPLGFQIGLDPSSRSLVIDQNLKLVHYKRVPYKLHSLEVWGCGTEVAMQKQQEFKHIAAKDVESRRIVKMNHNDWMDNPDRCLLEMAGARPTYAVYEKTSQNQFSKT